VNVYSAVLIGLSGADRLVGLVYNGPMGSVRHNRVFTAWLIDLICPSSATLVFHPHRIGPTMHVSCIASTTGVNVAGILVDTGADQEGLVGARVEVC